MDLDVAVVDRLLTTTRSVRKRLDLRRPVPPELIERCIEIALQSPTGSNTQGWHFIVVTDSEKRAGLARLYKRGFDLYASGQVPGRAEFAPDDPRAAQLPRIIDSASYLSEHLHEVPVHVIPCVEGRVEQAGPLAQASVYGSILPAAWSFMLAARARGLGSAWTTLHIMFEQEAAALLGIPSTVTQAALLPVAYYTGGDFKPAKRLPATQQTHWNGWGRRRGRVLDRSYFHVHTTPMRAVRRTISIPAAVASRLDREAKRRRTSFSALVTELVERPAGELPPYAGLVDDDPDLSLRIDEVLSRLVD